MGTGEMAAIDEGRPSTLENKKCKIHYPAGWVTTIWERRVVQYYFPQDFNM